MAPDSALSFAMFGVVLWLTGRERAPRAALVASAIIGSLVVTVTFAAILAQFSPSLRDRGWLGLTTMAPLTSVVLAAVAISIVLRSWQDALGPGLSAFSIHLWRMVGCAGAVTVAFALYARSETQIDRAHELRYRSHLLAEELRQSGDDLTRMARTYVVTGNPVYKQQFQEVLDIRDGRKPRPENYTTPYWDLLPGNGRPRAASPAIPLLELMRQAGFTEEEFGKLAEAKANSDGLTVPEFTAMKLVESAGSEAEADRARARTLLFDESYHRAKAAFMEPIYDFYRLLDDRTLTEVNAAQRSATIFRFLFALSGMTLMLATWRTYEALSSTLGASVDTVYGHIARIGSGDFSAQLPAKIGAQPSVMVWLSETQAKLNAIQSSREQAEESLRASERDFRSMFELASIGMAQANPLTGELIRVNQKLAAITGYSTEELVGARFQDITHPDDRERNWEEFQRAMQGEIPAYRIEKRYVRKDGVHTWVIVNVTFRRDVAGKPLYTISTIEDVTERKRAENAVRQSEDRLAFALAVSGTGAFDLDLADHTAQRSLQHDRIFGYQALLPTWTYEMFLDHVLPEDRAGVIHVVAGALSSQKSWKLECRIRRLDGEIRWISASGHHRFDESGVPRKLSGIVQDITDRKKTEEAIHTLNAELEQRVQDRTVELLAANKELEAFSYSVSHDLRAPLRAIDGFSSILLQDYNSHLDEEGRRLLGVVRSETRRMGQLVDDLLAFSRLGRQTLERSDVDLTALAQSVFNEQAALAPARVLRLKLEPLPCAHGDRALLRVVLVNLISNAIKFTGPRDSATITIGSRRETGETVYYVNDNGVGFDMKYVDKLFGVFQRLHSAEQFEGTGVGLALVQRVIHRHGGRVWAEGKTGEGATVYFSLPNSETA
jgi:PAS domain S-box-containing protein